MERFGSIKNVRSANQIQSLCRLCGMNNPGMTPICEDFDIDVIDLDDDPSLQRKIEACIGILVMPYDHLPQQCCGICTDKICDFYEFRLMCTSTDIQTRRLLGLPARDERKPIVNHEVSGKGRFVQPSKIKMEEPVLEEMAPPPDVVEESRRQVGKKKKNQYEPIIQLKRIKLENEEISCEVCKHKFTSEGDKYAHMYTIHVPTFAKYGCSSCGIALTEKDKKQHWAWHQKYKKPFICFRCGESHDKHAPFSKHIQNNRCSDPPEVTQPDIQCNLCRKKFGTRNLYEWHSCFIKNKTNCRKCGQYFANKHKLFDHFIKCPLPFIDLAPPKPAKAKVTAKKTTERNDESVKAEDDLDLASLLETNIEEDDKSTSSLSRMNSLLESVNDAIDKISEEQAKSKKKAGKKSKKKVTPLKIQIKPDPDGNVPEDEPEPEIEPELDHFGDDDDSNDSTSQTTTETSGSVTPAIRIKREKLDVGYGDHAASSTGETLQDVIRNIKKEPGTHTQEELSDIIKAHTNVQKPKKAINPLNALKKKKKATETQQQLILRIKKERSEKGHEESVDVAPLAINPVAAAKKKSKKSKLLRIPAKLALKIKKEKAKKKNMPLESVPTVQIKQEKPDSDEEHHEGPIATDYLGINPLSLLKQKNTQIEATPVSNTEALTETVPEKLPEETPNPISSLFGAKKSGFMKLSMNSTGLDFPKDPVQMPVIANIVSGADASFVDPMDVSPSEKEPESTDDSKKSEDVTEVAKEVPISHVTPPVMEKPKMGGFMKISGSALQFLGTKTSFPESSTAKPVESSSIPTVSISNAMPSADQTSQLIIAAPKAFVAPPPPIIPGFGSGTGFKKLSAFALPTPNTSNEITTPSLTFPKPPDNNIQMPVISNVTTTGISTFDLDDLISSPSHTTDIDMDSLINEKLMDDRSYDNGTDDFLKEIDEQLGNG